jgi:hypothetical protein
MTVFAGIVDTANGGAVIQRRLDERSAELSDDADWLLI